VLQEKEKEKDVVEEMVAAAAAKSGSERADLRCSDMTEIASSLAPNHARNQHVINQIL
jgi:hypothetical protein